MKNIRNLFFVEAFCFLVLLCFFVHAQVPRSHKVAGPVQVAASVQVVSSPDSLQQLASVQVVQSSDSIQVKTSTASVQKASRKLEVKDSSSLYYEEVKDSVNVDWEEEIPLFHYWRDIKPDEYLFNVPTQE